MSSCGADLYWLPVGAETSRFQQMSLRAWEAFEAARSRRPRARLVHSALKLATAEGSRFTLELAPAFAGGPVPPLATGPVGLRGADRWRVFRYQLQRAPRDRLPDEHWTVAVERLTDDCEVVARLLALAPAIPRLTWGRRAQGTSEMWTSDSVVAWLLARADIDLSRIAPPPGGRAPGWAAGLELAADRQGPGREKAAQHRRRLRR